MVHRSELPSNCHASFVFDQTSDETINAAKEDSSNCSPRTLIPWSSMTGLRYFRLIVTLSIFPVNLLPARV
jgi:hypothetical protein